MHIEKIEKNPELRTLATLFLNSVREKFVKKRDDFSHIEYIFAENVHRYYDLCSSNRVKLLAAPLFIGISHVLMM